MTKQEKLGKAAYEAVLKAYPNRFAPSWALLSSWERTQWIANAQAVIEHIRRNPGLMHGECEAGH